ncbi:hypothetical protein MTO96_012438 [Rhipicephalus appendiculatus]
MGSAGNATGGEEESEVVVAMVIAIVCAALAVFRTLFGESLRAVRCDRGLEGKTTTSKPESEQTDTLRDTMEGKARRRVAWGKWILCFASAECIVSVSVSYMLADVICFRIPIVFCLSSRFVYKFRDIKQAGL